MDRGREDTCLVLGAADTGKTTRIRRMVSERAGSRRVGVIDCDPGQSVIGPPGCVGWAVFDKPVEDFSNITADGISFVGHVTPTEHLLQLLSSLVRAVEALRKRCDITLIDTPGYVAGAAARALWWNVIKAIRPTSLIALERSNEMEDILRGIERFDIPIERVRVPSEVPIKPEGFRRDYRRRQMERYFAAAREITIKLGEVSVQTYHTPRPREWAGHVAALADASGYDRALGVVREAREGKLRVWTPLAETEEVRAITIGDFVFERER